jgi:hypothetical protein
MFPVYHIAPQRPRRRGEQKAAYRLAVVPTRHVAFWLDSYGVVDAVPTACETCKSPLHYSALDFREALGVKRIPSRDCQLTPEKREPRRFGPVVSEQTPLERAISKVVVERYVKWR